MVRLLLAVLLVLSPLAPVQALDYDLGFSPGGTAVKTVVAAIASAKQTVAVAAYEFTSAPVAQALAAAVTRGVRVWAVLDARSAKEKASQASWLAAHGIGVRVNSHYAIFHHKFLVIDQSTVETGSFNYTAAADKRNAENALVLRGVPDLANAYLTEWKRLWDEGDDL
jgi:phosphatidylserine/phosphatidylglycerophosphate/cardiolipin synthase-like enzyme